ncbi:50S ribosomal protein L29 [Blattabacterium cuenoti]|uniref:Large ribosomal subunit protein uL29 n=1 Tax=Blattabacterium cuenoti BPAA TaxID=1229512 RepID=M4ZTW9_9FLAO|nr:50S ribosomal protein L29 [Blattabacterium cuenoti]BAM99670.1 50S ribosomal protein L29 [Blattabacterium cuenoti BPAA]
MNNLNTNKIPIHDLMKKIKQYQKDYQNMKFYHHIKTLKNPMKIRFLRRNIAKLKTEYNKINQ